MIRALNFIQKQTRILQAYFRLSKSPFNSGNAFYSLSLDYAYNTKSIEELKMAFEETERYLAEDFNNASMADLYYDLGTAYSNLNNASDITSFLNGENDSLNYCLCAICRIRNNMLHGEKDVYSIDRQREMINAAVEILSFLCLPENVQRYNESIETLKK